METLNRLFSKISAISDRKQRAYLICEYLRGLSPRELAITLEDIVNFGLREDMACKELLFSITDILEKIFVWEKEDFENLFFNALSRITTSNRTLNLFIKPPDPHHFLKRGEMHNTDILMDYLPLGIKRSFAKKMDKHLLKRMLQEKDPIVVKYLINNPLITEKEVLKIISDRPNTVNVIKTVYGSEKWIKNYNVKAAIIKNPYSPFRIALLLLFWMNSKELKEVRIDETLHPELRIEAERLEKLRSYLKG